MNSPYADAIGRWFNILIGAVGAVACAAAVAWSLATGTAPAIGRLGRIAGPDHTLATDPSQFWFGVAFYAAVGAALGWGAWRAWRR